MLIKKYNYIPLNRKTDNNTRHYITPTGEKVASVTTILSKTKPKEDQDKLDNWVKRVGVKKASQIKTEAANRGTSMHSYLEEYCLTDSIEKKVREQQKPYEFIISTEGYQMANIVIQEGLKDLNECWGVEVPVYYPELYAGTMDAAGIFDNVPCILDFKQTNKPKRREWINDYFLQLVAYGQAHNKIHNTDIKSGVILMCSKDLQFQKFVLEGLEYQKYIDLWWNRVEQYYIN